MKEYEGDIMNCTFNTAAFATGRVCCNLIKNGVTKAIVTSRVVSIECIGGELFIETLNSFYKVEGKLRVV